MIEEGEIEAVQVVVFQHVRISRANVRGEPADEIGFARVVVGVGFEHERIAHGVPDRDHEDPVVPCVEAGGFEIELETVELVEWEIAKVGTAGSDEVLLFGGK